MVWQRHWAATSVWRTDKESGRSYRKRSPQIHAGWRTEVHLNLRGSKTAAEEYLGCSVVWGRSETCDPCSRHRCLCRPGCETVPVGHMDRKETVNGLALAAPAPEAVRGSSRDVAVLGTWRVEAKGSWVTGKGCSVLERGWGPWENWGVGVMKLSLKRQG